MAGDIDLRNFPKNVPPPAVWVDYGHYMMEASRRACLLCKFDSPIKKGFVPIRMWDSDEVSMASFDGGTWHTIVETVANQQREVDIQEAQRKFRKHKSLLCAAAHQGRLKWTYCSLSKSWLGSLR